MDKGEDPDTFIRRKGRRSVPGQAKGSRPYLEYLLDQAAQGLDFQARREPAAVSGQDAHRRGADSRAAARDQFADRIAHKARITEEVVRAEIRKAAVNRKTIGHRPRELPSFGQLKHAEKGLIWGLIHNTARRWRLSPGWTTKISNELAGRAVLEVARSLHEQTAGALTIDTIAASKYSERPARHAASPPPPRRPAPPPLARARSSGCDGNANALPFNVKSTGCRSWAPVNTDTR